MRCKFQKLFLIIACCLCQSGFAQYKIRYPDAIPLHGEWQFALDPAEMGVQGKWYATAVKHASLLDPVTVPHCFSADPRYEHYTGTAWYRKSFLWKPTNGKRVILHFDAAYYKTRIWLNDQKVGEHEGGYTPFSFDITDFLKDGDNLLAVSVNNDTWKPGTIPGAKDWGEINNSFVGWMNYGGLIRPVYLTVEPEVYAENLKIDALPELAKGTAILKTTIRIRNASQTAASPKISYQVISNGKLIPVTWKTRPVSITAGQSGLAEAEATLTIAQTRLWELDAPHLYQLKATIGEDSISSNFGIRKVEVRNAQLLLNGKSIRVGGGNRVVDHPGLGSLEPDWLVEKDFKLMKEAGMEFQRLTHYTPSEYFYDLADKYGMLIVTEAGNWQLTPNQMDNDSIRRKFRSQFTEMAERDWNHPSVIAYSVGNEYLSEQPAGQRWTKDMIAFARSLDPTRLYTFASMRLNILPKNPEDEASQYVDFVSTNTYGNHARSLDHIHTLYPDKPILVSEWGVRADAKDEAFQARHITDLMADFRKRPYVVGTSWWTYNDYQSRHYGTNPNGSRPWGIVRGDRSLRPAYIVHQTEFAPLTVEKTSFKTGGQGEHLLTLRIQARGDFPARAIKGYQLQWAGKSIPLPDLNPGESKDVQIPIAGFDKQVHISIKKPTGFTALEADIELK
jgi:beta-glucuronidase